MAQFVSAVNLLSAHHQLVNPHSLTKGTRRYYLAQHLLTEFHFPSTRGTPLVNYDALRSARILELGSGTGLLAILLCSLCASYTASDRWENLKLIKRNLERNGTQASGRGAAVGSPSSPRELATSGHVNERGSANSTVKRPASHSVAAQIVTLEEIDWVAISQDIVRNASRSPKPPSSSTTPDADAYDLVLCVDCIFNEHLVQPLVDTLGHYCSPGGKTVVWVIVELRSSEVVSCTFISSKEALTYGLSTSAFAIFILSLHVDAQLSTFLSKWMDDSYGKWSIVRLSSGSMGDWNGQKPRWVGWIGWR